MLGWLKKKSQPNGPDFSHVDELAKAQELAAKGELVKLFMLPPDFGGADIPQNVLYVPPWIVEIKRRIDENVIRPLIMSDKVTKYAATPEYQGKSFVPIAITIKASEPGEFTTTINIWGEALARGE